MTTEKHQCSEDVREYGGWLHQCPRTGKFQVGGKWYCKVHDPDEVASRAAKREASRKTKWAIVDLREKEVRAMRRATQGLTIEELKRLTPDMLRQLLNN